MISYLEQSLSDDEKLISVGRFHWFYDMQAMMNLFWGLFFAVMILVTALNAEPYLPGKLTLLTAPLYVGDGWVEQLQKLHPIIKLASVLFFLFGVLRFAHMLVIKVTTEIAVTTHRVIFKRGLVARYVGEMNINRIEGVSVSQSFWGRIFDFGSIIIRGMGVGEMFLPPIARPLMFRRAIEKAQTLAEDRKDN
jgi:uncharacterized membrane protein YdbT with pleckstrin-like domain